MQASLTAFRMKGQEVKDEESGYVDGQYTAFLKENDNSHVLPLTPQKERGGTPLIQVRGKPPQ